MASSRATGPVAGQLVPVNFSFPGSVSATASKYVALPEGLKYKVARVTYRVGTVVATASLQLGDNTGLAIHRADTALTSGDTIDVAGVLADTEKTAVGGTSTLIATMTISGGGSAVDCTLTAWLHITDLPTALRRR